MVYLLTFCAVVSWSMGQSYDFSDTQVQSSAGITRSNITWYWIQFCSNWIRRWIKIWIHKRRASYGVSLVSIVYKAGRLITAPHWNCPGNHDVFAGKQFQHCRPFVKKFPSQWASNAELLFLWCEPEQDVEKTIQLPVVWNTMVLKWHHCNVYTLDLYRTWTTHELCVHFVFLC